RLLHFLGLHLVLETSALVVEVLLGLEALAALAVEALVGLLVEHGLAGLGRERILEAPEQFLNGEPVLGVGGAEELVVMDAQRLPRRDERLRQLVHERGRRLARRGRGPSDLLAVLVRAREVVGRIALLAVPARDGVGEDLLVGMAQVGPAIHVVDGGCDVETGHERLRGGSEGWRSSIAETSEPLIPMRAKRMRCMAKPGGHNARCRRAARARPCYA